MQIAPFIYATRCPFATAWIQVVLVVGAHAALIDSGLAPSHAQVMDLVAEAGIAPAQVRYIVNSHAHWDHVGGNAALAARTGAAVAAHPAGQRWIQDAGLQFREFFGAYPEVLPVAPEREASYREMMGPDAPVALFLQNGDVLDLGGGIRLEVLETPGHLASCLTLWEPGSRTLFTGDSVNARGAFGGVAQYDDVTAYRESLAALLARGPAQIVPAHFEGQRGDAALEFLRTSYAHTFVQENAVLDAAAHPGTLGEITRGAARQLGVPFTVQAVLTVEAHLKDLQSAGRVRFKDGVYRAV